MLIEGSDYFVRFIDFPTCACGGVVTPNDDGTFSIYINSKCSHAQNKKSMRHELRHIEHDDFYRNAPIEQIEREANEEG